MWRRAGAWISSWRALAGWRAGLVLFVAGLLSTLAHAPFHVLPALAFGLIILVLALDGAASQPRPLRAGFWRGWSFAAGYFLGSTWWVANAFLVSAEEHAWLIWAPLTLLPGGLALFWGVAGSLHVRLTPKGPMRIGVFAVLFTGVEFLRSVVLSGFPWNLPGHVFEAGTPVSQIASVTGALGLSALVLFAFASPAALSGPGRLIARALPLGVSALLLGGIWGWGHARLASAEEGVTDTRLRIVQVNVDQRDKRYANRHDILARYLELTMQPGLGEADAVIWPEGAIPTLMLEDSAVLLTIEGTLPEGTRLWTGVTRRERFPEGELYYNTLAALRIEDGRVEGEAFYDKVHLVPFGEGNPLLALTSMFGFSSLSMNAPFYTPGPGARTLGVAGMDGFAPLICYEVIFPRFAPRGANRPAYPLNISNDAWYGNSAGPRQHLNQAAYRAIEEGLPMVRSASLGVSGVMDAYGRALTASDPQLNTVLDIDVPVALQPTAFARYGNIPWIVAGFLILICLWGTSHLLLRRVPHVRSEA
ncbi:MAG: apolipoprotein N-acyltransferase [Caulobacterales bacterium]|uniref:apolipoprotein N-acyltransferase n=1 Tax=Glycocaulis sp. TaxID=1969725 RepID=UPI003F9F1E38